jgi:DNA-binding IclR family transcriptional regulator
VISDTVKSAARALELLEIFALKRQRMSAANIGAILDYPKSSLNVLLKSLVSQGYLSFSPVDLMYFPTSKVTHLGDWLPAMNLGSEEILSELQRLRDRTGETITVTQPAGSRMRVLQALVGTAPIALQLDDKTTFAIAGTAVGQAFLSTLDVATLRRTVARLAAERGRSDVLDVEAEIAAVARIKELGYAAGYERVMPDVGAIAMPLTISGEAESLVLTVAGLSHRIRSEEARLIEELREAVVRLGRRTKGAQ